MVEETQKPEIPPWLYKLFTGHQYPFVRRQAKFGKKDRKIGEPSSEPTREEIDAKFWEIYPYCSAKVALNGVLEFIEHPALAWPVFETPRIGI